ncbi:tRNA (uracil-5-)-methyltransferase [Gammaproteobacteria bacterium]|nr:tRNA (uracil-5-)-methyltransferase [Gammaproteobacteria bacterium]
MNKFSQFCADLATFTDLKPTIHNSSATGYRARSEFGFSKDAYTMIEGGQKVYMSVSGLPHSSIQKIMIELLPRLQNSEVIKKKLFQINFRTSGAKILATLIYHKPLEENWKAEALNIQNSINNLSIVGRSKKQKVLIGPEDLEVTCNYDNASFKILQNDLVFFQPNFYLYPLMIAFITRQLKDPKDLLELYCGCGGFTLPLASKFNKIFATENNRHSIRLLKESIELNKLSNIEIARLSDDETASALANERPFRRLKNIDIQAYEFSHILVDPPRAGLSEETINLSKQFDNMIYISCNPETFLRDVTKLDRKIESIGVFDQFANTGHLEIIAFLK